MRMDPTRSPDRALIHEHQLERKLARQMGCMAGFFQIFSRHHLLTGRRIHSSRSLPSSPAQLSTSPSGRSEASMPSLLKDNYPHRPPESRLSSLESVEAPAELPPRPSLPLKVPVFDFKDGLRPWNLREAPRLSLDSRAVMDAKGKLRPCDIRKTRSAPSDDKSDIPEKTEREKHHRNPSVVARLMGLDALPIAGGGGGDADLYHSELRRSASESRVPRDSPYSRFEDTASFERKKTPGSAAKSTGSSLETKVDGINRRPEAKKTEPPPLRRSYLDTADFFPEQMKTGSLFGEFDKRLQKRGIDEPERDLEALKQNLESLQFKGLLRSNSSYGHLISARRNIIYDGNSRITSGSPIVVMKPKPKSSRRPFGEPPPPSSRSMPQRRNTTTSSESTSPALRDRSVDRRLVQGNDKRNQAPMSPERPPARRRFSYSAEKQSTPQPERRIIAVNSPKLSTRRMGPGSVTVGSSGNCRSAVLADSTDNYSVSPSEDDTATTVSERSVGSSQYDSERPRPEEYRSGRELLDRCDKLLSSIVAFTAAEQQPSPVSVLDSSPYLGGEECSPSPEVKRSIDYKDWDEDHCNAFTPTNFSSQVDEEAEYGDADFAYVSRILDASSNGYLDTSAEAFVTLEKRHYASVSSDAGRLHRRLVFDTVVEILDRRRHLSPWDAYARARSRSISSSAAAADVGGVPLLRQVWAEFRRPKEQAPADDLNDVTCEAIMNDMDGDHLGGGVWGHRPAIEFSNVAFFIERQVMKDLVTEAIRVLTDDECRPVPRRKLVFY